MLQVFYVFVAQVNSGGVLGDSLMTDENNFHEHNYYLLQTAGVGGENE